MTDSCKTTVLAGVAGGYLLGRTKKAKLALTFAALVAGKRLAPRALRERQAGKTGDTPPLTGLSGQVKDQMMAAVGSLFDRRVESFTESLRERTDRLGALGEEREAREDRDEEDRDRGRHTAAADRRPPGRKKQTGRAGSAATGPRKKAPSGGGSGSRGTGKGAGRSTGKKTADRPRGRQRS